MFKFTSKTIIIDILTIVVVLASCFGIYTEISLWNEIVPLLLLKDASLYLCLIAVMFSINILLSKQLELIHISDDK